MMGRYSSVLGRQVALAPKLFSPGMLLRMQFTLVLLFSFGLMQSAVPSELLVSVDVVLDGIETSSPLQLFEGQTTISAAVAFCEAHRLLPENTDPHDNAIVQQLSQLLQSRLKEAEPSSDAPALTMSVTLDDSEVALQHYEGADPRAEANAFCIEHGFGTKDETGALLASCVTTLEGELRNRIAQIAQQRIRESTRPTDSTDLKLEVDTYQDAVIMRIPVEIGDRTATLELLENESPADAAHRFLQIESILEDSKTDEGQLLVAELENAIRDRIALAADTTSSNSGSGALFAVPISVNGVETILEIIQGQSPLLVAETFCRRGEYGFRGATLVSCIEQAERLVRAKLAAAGKIELSAPVPDSEKVDEDAPLFTLPVTIGGQLVVVPYYSEFTPSETAAVFCESQWEAITAGSEEELKIDMCTALITDTISTVLNRVVDRNEQSRIAEQRETIFEMDINIGESVEMLSFHTDETASEAATRFLRAHNMSVEHKDTIADAIESRHKEILSAAAGTSEPSL